jgi:hypothetical protein
MSSRPKRHELLADACVDPALHSHTTNVAPAQEGTTSMSTEPKPSAEAENEPAVDQPPAEGARMTAKERTDLMAMARMRSRVAKAQVAQRAAELEADFEEQLGTIYEFDRDEVWREAVRLASEAAAAASKVINDRCAELGIPPEFAPSLSGPGWYNRGANAVAERRAELRKMAKARIGAMAKRATAQIDAASVGVQEQLLSDGLTTAAAQTFFASMPTPADLMPPLALHALLEAGRPAQPSRWDPEA